jgi:hypothetical protein
MKCKDPVIKQGDYDNAMNQLRTIPPRMLVGLQSSRCIPPCVIWAVDALDSLLQAQNAYMKALFNYYVIHVIICMHMYSKFV